MIIYAGKCVKKNTWRLFSDYSGICRCDPFGKYFADASGFLFGQSATPFHEALLQATRQVCYRTCSKGQRKLLVCIQQTLLFLCYTNRWGLWSSDRSERQRFRFFQEKYLMQRSTMQDAISAPKVGGIVRLTRFILKDSLIVPAGAMLLPWFLIRLWLKGIWMAVFHSISSFCNAQDLTFWEQQIMPFFDRYSGNILIRNYYMLIITGEWFSYLGWYL